MQTFFRFQVTAIIATVADFGILVFLKEIMGLYYVIATSIGALCGAIINFLLGRHWAFASTQNKWTNQVFKYALVSGGSLILNTLFVYLLTDHLQIEYRISKIITTVVIAIFYNYSLQKYFVFKS